MRTSLRLLLSLLVASLLLAALFRWGGVSLEELLEIWASLPLSVFLQALFVHLGVYTVRATRYRVLLPPEQRPPLPAMLAIAWAHNLAVYVLPAKTGEGTLVLYLRKLCAVPAKVGLASLVVSRLLDLATLAGFLALATLVLAAAGTLPGAWAWPFGALLLVGSVALYVVSARGGWLVCWLTAIVGFLRLDGTRLGRKLDSVANEVADALHVAAGEGRLGAAALLSALVWTGIFGFYFVLSHGFGMNGDLGPVEVAFGSSWAMLANLLPINGFAAAGTQELGWVVGFEQVGVDRALALSSGLGVHLVQLANVVLFGVLGHAAMALVGSRAAPNSR